MDAEIRLVVQGAPNTIDVHALRDAAAALVDFLQGSTNQRWVVSRLAIGSLDLGARPEDATQETVDREFADIVSGLESLASATAAPRSWRDSALHGIAELGRVSNWGGVEGIVLHIGSVQFPVTDELVAGAKRLLDQGLVSYGSVTGIIDRFRSRGSAREFGLIDPETSGAVTVRFNEADEQQVLEAIGKTVTAWGTLKRTPEGKKGELRMEGLEVQFERSLPAPTVDDVTGLLGREWTGRAASVDWVRDQRDG